MFVFIQTVWEENNKFDENNKFGLSHAKCVVLLSLDFKRLFVQTVWEENNKFCLYVYCKFGLIPCELN